MVGSSPRTVQPESRNFTSADARSGGFLAVPLRAIRQFGPAAQSLGGVMSALRADGSKTYRRHESLANLAQVPVRTFKRHLATLEAAGCVQVTREPNRTNVTSVKGAESDWMADGFLPITRFAKGLSWSQRLVYSWGIYRAELSLDGATCEDSVAKMAAALGITKRSIYSAIVGLVDRGLIERTTDLPGEVGRCRLVDPEPADVGSEKVAQPPVKKWPPPSEKVARPSSKKLIKKKTGQKRPDQRCVSVGGIERDAADLFRRAGYTGDDGGLFWLMAAMMSVGLVSDHEAHDAANGARECRATNRPAYARAILARHVRRRGGDLNALLRAVKVGPSLPTGPPDVARGGPMVPNLDGIRRRLADSLTLKASG